MNVSYVKLGVMEETVVATATTATTATTKPIPLDDIDLKIIKLLSRDCRTPFRKCSLLGDVFGIRHRKSY
jgi:hypothetical protein